MKGMNMGVEFVARVVKDEKKWERGLLIGQVWVWEEGERGEEGEGGSTDVPDVWEGGAIVGTFASYS
jgi:hypothetical protein